MADRFEDVDFSGRPDWMSQEQYAAKFRRENNQDFNRPDFMSMGQASRGLGREEAQGPAFGGNMPVAPLPVGGAIFPDAKAGAMQTLEQMQGFTPPSPVPQVTPNLPPQYNPLTMPQNLSPLEGRAGMPEAGIPQADGSVRTPEDIQRGVEMTRMRRELEGQTPSGFIREKSADMEDMQDRAKLRSITKNLESRGMSREEIARKIGYEPGMSNKDALTAIQRVQKESSKAVKGSDANKARTRDRLVQGSEWGTDEAGNRIPMNTVARGFVLQERMDSFGPDPSNTDSPLSENLDDAQKRRMDRIISKMSTNDKWTKDDEKWAENTLKVLEAKRERKYAGAEAKREKEKQEQQRKNVESLIKSREERGLYNKEKAEQDKLYKIWQDSLKSNAYDQENQDVIDARKAYEAFSFTFESPDQPAPTVSGAPLTADLAEQYLLAAGGDKDAARRAAKKDGYTF